ncbi:MAG TPA: YegS/Rv2252/BmrU family lipid kinase [Thermoanaerobaculia bacterium]
MPVPTGALFLNPSSGAKLTDDDRAALKAAAIAEGLEVHEVTPSLDCNAVIRERIERGVKLFVAAGGDGTIHSVIQPLVRTDAVLGVIPVGTYNHFARDAGLPLDWKEALEVVMRGTTRPVDAARVNDRYFINNLSIGLYPELVMRREERGRDYPRWKARLYALYATLRKYPHVNLTLEADARHEAIRTHVFIVSNNSYDLSRVGIEAPRTSLEDGTVSVYWLPHLRRLALARFAARYLAGRAQSAQEFQSFVTRSVRVETTRPSLQVGLDGEVVRLTAPLVITSVPQALAVRVPA